MREQANQLTGQSELKRQLAPKILFRLRRVQEGTDPELETVLKSIIAEPIDSQQNATRINK